MTSIDKIEAFVYRCPIQQPVQTSFGIMRDRPAVFVRVTDKDGAVGWGEIWCNFPAVGAEHRARLVSTVFADMLQGQTFSSPSHAFEMLTERTAVLAIQSAEPGPISQCIAGIDTALWDLQGQRQGQPLWRLLGGESPTLRVYASGLNPTDPEKLAEQCHEAGYRAFKLKVGFGRERDHHNLRAMRESVGNCELMVDANQAWDLPTALSEAANMEPFGLRWLEEPLRANRPWSEWDQLAEGSEIPLAAGENLAGHDCFGQALAHDALRVVQPDLAKWGGISGCLPLARLIRQSGRRYCPHFLGAGIGLLASAHLLAAVGGDGVLEVDANPNSLRTLTCGPLNHITDGFMQLTEDHGLGAKVDVLALREYLVAV